MVLRWLSTAGVALANNVMAQSEIEADVLFARLMDKFGQ